MNRLIYYGSVQAIPFYNCSWKTSEEWTSTGTKRPWLGIPLVIFGTLIEFLYVPVLYIIFKTRLIRHPCYKIIVLLALIDMSATCCSCLISGPMLIMGTVFCSFPTFTYIAGGFALNTWCMACCTTIFLFANRVVSIAFQEYADVIEKKLAYTSIALVLIYGTYMLFFTPTLAYHSEYMAWLPDPMSEEVPSEAAAEWYKNTVQAWNNWIFVGCMFSLATIYCVLVKRIARGQKSKASKAIFFQCCVICFFNTIVALIYNALSMFTPAYWILLLGQVCWAVNHGIPAIIYVTMNDTIKKEFRKLIFGKSRRVDATTTTGTKHSSSNVHSSSRI